MSVFSDMETGSVHGSYHFFISGGHTGNCENLEISRIYNTVVLKLTQDIFCQTFPTGVDIKKCNNN